MDRLLLIAGATAIAGAVAALMQRRRPDPPSSPTYHVPRQLDREDFSRPDAALLVAVFTSATCSTCAAVWENAQILESDDTATQEVEANNGVDLHRRYGVDGVPMALVADRHGVVQSSFLGPVDATELEEAVHRARRSGNS